jgi:nucleoside-diphosphate-sugar epimerase
LIALSSTSVYGTQKAVVAEDCAPDELKPQSPYAITKLKEERLIKKLCAESGLKAISCRFGTIFGASPGMRFHTAVNKFCWQAVMGQPITVWSTAYDQKRPYLDLLDATRAITFIIRKDIFDARIYNVLTHNHTVGQIVETVRDFVPDLQVSFVDNTIMNQLSYEVSCERFMQQGFVFAGDLRRGIGDTISLLRQANLQSQ